MPPATHLELPELPVPFMNADHAHAAEQWQAMLAALDDYPANPERLLDACAAFLQHNREHFQREEAAMRASGFPPYAVHKQEHERVLGWLEGLLASIRAGADDARLRDAIQRELGDWLRQHVQTMDRVTSLWIESHPV